VELPNGSRVWSRGRLPSEADALYRRFEHDTFGLGWPVFSKLMHHAGGSTDAGDAGRLFLMPGFRIPFWPKPSSDRRTPRYLWRSLAACVVGLALSLAAALATGQREIQLAQIELNGLANGYALTLQFGINT